MYSPHCERNASSSASRTSSSFANWASRIAHSLQCRGGIGADTIHSVHRWQKTSRRWHDSELRVRKGHAGITTGMCQVHVPISQDKNKDNYILSRTISTISKPRSNTIGKCGKKPKMTESRYWIIMSRAEHRTPYMAYIRCPYYGSCPRTVEAIGARSIHPLLYGLCVGRTATGPCTGLPVDWMFCTSDVGRLHNSTLRRTSYY